MIIQEVYESDFIKEFDNYNRSDNFSIAGRTALFDYLDETYTEENPFKLDIIGLCCDFIEYESIEDYLREYNTDIEKKDYIDEESKEFDEESYNKAVEEEINDNTLLLKFEDDINKGFIIQGY